MCHCITHSNSLQKQRMVIRRKVFDIYVSTYAVTYMYIVYTMIMIITDNIIDTKKNV